MEPLEARVAELEQRLARLEEHVAAGVTRGPSPPATSGAARGPSAGGPFDVFDLLRSRSAAGADSGGSTGTVLYAGSVSFGDRRYLWAREHAAGDVASARWAVAAPLLERLGSAARLALLAALLAGPRSRRELQEALGETSTGHLYHHLRELQAAGLLLQPRRGEYEIASQAVVPLMTIVAAAMDLGDPAELARYDPADEESAPKPESESEPEPGPEPPEPPERMEGRVAR